MKRFFLISVAMMLGTMLSAQTQQGYVKTKGRLANDGSVIAGTRIPNATIQVKDRTPVVSQTDGAFSFPIPAKNFYLTNVQKQGYVLTDPEVLSKQYSYSANDLIIVMEDLTQREADKRAIERRISGKLYAQLLQQGEEIDNLREQNKITEEKYRELLQQLNQYQDDNEKIIKDMAERYTKMDFDQIDEFNRKVSEYILNGELLKADSMINIKGDLQERIDQLNQQHEANLQVRADLEKSESLEQRNREDIANDCYSKFEIFKMRHENDSAAYYLELRAGLDTTNIVWLAQYGDFVQEYFANYEKAIELFHIGLIRSISLYGKENEMTALCYYHLGWAWRDKGDFIKALDYYEKACAVFIAIDKNHSDLSKIYNNIGIVYSYLNDYDKSIEYLMKSLNLCKSNYGEFSVDVAQSYNNLGIIYKELDDYDTAFFYYQKALDIFLPLFGESHPETTTTINNIGVLYGILGNYDEALQCQNKVLAAHRIIYGEQHPYTASSYNNIGIIYDELEDYTPALECYEKALAIWKATYGNKHPNVALCLNNIGSVYYALSDYEKAFKYLKSALSIFLDTYGEINSYVASMQNNIGVLYYNIKDFESALQYYNTALSTRLILFGENHSDVALLYNNIGNTYAQLGDYPKSLEYLFKSLNIKLFLFGESHPQVATSYNNIASTYCDLKEYENALEYYNKALEIRKQIYGEDDPKTIRVKENIDSVRSKLKEQE